MFDFKESLKKGSSGEEIFLEKYKDIVTRLDGRQHDFQIKGTGEYIELKSDYYDMNKTPNFFLERWSDIHARKMGGPWQAAVNGNDFFVYFFVKNGRLFRFYTMELIMWLREHENEYNLIDIPNKGWTTQGYKVPREALAHIYKETTL